MYLAYKYIKDKTSKKPPANADEALPDESLIANDNNISFTGGPATYDEKKQRRKMVMLQLVHFLATMIVDVGLPLMLYYVLKDHTSQLVALIVSGVPPLVWVIFKFIWYRKVDALGCLFVVCYALSAVLSVISGDARLALLRDSSVTCVVSVMFLFSLLPIRTRWFRLQPLTYLFGNQMVGGALPDVRWTDQTGNAHEQPMFEFFWDHVQIFRRYNYTLTLLWGIILMAEFVAKIIMIESSLTIDQIVLIGNIIIAVVMTVMTIGTTVASISIRKRTRLVMIDWFKANDYTEQFKSAPPTQSTQPTPYDPPTSQPAQSPFRDEFQVNESH
ncbi:hypothetical protein DM01DRAFT_1333043 [Hesseltinella vesiculosa]|uniref:Uncharacterized protein n=1 Tax=Hesseltinella vesiculosa TaxID=101127 RepID=A0A1X2GR92_9FUNG|nr:hypothetical protein DM01DRAFT_1333043 [Hesseltinella vesiculosa]